MKKPVELDPGLCILVLECDSHVVANLRLEDGQFGRVLRELLHLVKLRSLLLQLVDQLDLILHLKCKHLDDDLKAVARVVVVCNVLD